MSSIKQRDNLDYDEYMTPSPEFLKWRESQAGRHAIGGDEWWLCWRTAQDAALASQRELMECGHPKWALRVLETDAPDGSMQPYAEECSWCESLRAERENWVQLLRHAINTNHGYKPQGCSPCGEIEAVLRERLEKEQPR